MCSYFIPRLTLAEYHEQEEIFKLRLGHLKKVCMDAPEMRSRIKLQKEIRDGQDGQKKKYFDEVRRLL